MMPYYNSYQQSYNPNSYLPQNYNQQSFPQQSYNAPSPLMQANNCITWVQGEAGAKAYPVAAGSSVLLMDSEDKCFYIKSTDMSGIPQPLRVFTYEEIIQTQHSNNSNNSYAALPDFHPEEYAKKQEVEELKDQMNRLVRQQENNKNQQHNSNNNQPQLPQVQGMNSNGGQNYA